MIHIEKIKLLAQSYPGSHVLQLNKEFICNDVNLFVGNQGCGKSTMLQLLQQNHKDLDITLAYHVIKQGIKSFYFDSEKDNPRVKDIEAYSTPSGNSKGFGVGNALVSRFKSHGEVLVDFIITPLLKSKDCVILLDEPESGLSITNQFLLIDVINKAIKNNCQFFIATHCYPLIEAFDVISLEHNQQLSGKEFIKLVKNK